MYKKYCQHCGNNPVPHFLFWYFESCNVLLTPLRKFLIKLNFFKIFSFIFYSNSKKNIFILLLLWLKILKIQNDFKKCKVKRAQVLWEEGLKRGIVMQELLLFGKSIDLYFAEKGIKKILFFGLPRPKGHSELALDILDDKFLLKTILQKNKFPVPVGLSVCNFFKAKKIFEKITKPVIVKPRLGSRGRHSTTFVYNLSDLKKAYKVAKQLCFWVLVEEQLAGPVYRATVINYKLAGVLKGDAPSIVGDGLRSIENLIEIKNQTRQEKIKEINIDKNIKLFLQRQNLQLSTILEKGKKVFLTEKIGINYGGSSSEDFEICHLDNVNLFERAARVLGDPLIGFDFIIPDISISYKNQRCGFIEANSLPFIQLHHEPLLGKPKNVAEKIWQMIGF